MYIKQIDVVLFFLFCGYDFKFDWFKREQYF